MVGFSISCLYFPAFVVSFFNTPVPVFLFSLNLQCKVVQLITIEQCNDIVSITERGSSLVPPVQSWFSSHSKACLPNGHYNWSVGIRPCN